MTTRITVQPNRSFYFIRHGQTDWNLEKRMQGHTDIPLNQVGLEQAERAADLFEKIRIDVIISSPLSRAYKTAEAIAKRKGLEIIAEPLLKERHFGKFDGRTIFEVFDEHGLPHTSSISAILPSCAEQWHETRERSLNVVIDYLNKHEGNVLFVSHGAVFRALYECLGGPRLEAENAKPYYFELNPDKTWKLVDQF